MANPQKENGYVSIANEIVESLSKYRLPGEATQILWVILRKTYGWNKKEDEISLTQFSILTGLKRCSVVRATNLLLRKKIIYKNVTGFISIYRFNKDFESWEPFTKKIPTYIREPAPPKACLICEFDKVVHRHHIIPVSKGGSNGNENIAILCPNCHSMVHQGIISAEVLSNKKATGYKNVNKNENTSKNLVTKKQHTIYKNLTKDTYKDISTLFLEFWESYPKRNGKKIGKDDTLNQFCKLEHVEQEQAVLAAKNYFRSKQAREGFAVDPIRFFKSREYPNGLWRSWVEPEEGIIENVKSRHERIFGIHTQPDNVAGNIHREKIIGRGNENLGDANDEVPEGTA